MFTFLVFAKFSNIYKVRKVNGSNIRHKTTLHN